MPASDAPYPRAAILTAWINAWVAGDVDGLASCPAVSPAAAVSTEVGPGSGAARAAGQPASRRGPLGLQLQPLGQTLALLVAEHGAQLGATALLPVAGDPAGLPPDARAPRESGEVTVLSDGRPGDPQYVLFPATGGDRVTARWRLDRAHVASAAMVTDLRTARLQIMELLPRVVGLAESAGGRPMSDGALRERLRLLEEVPLPPGSAPAAVELARRSAALLAIVGAAAEGLDGDPGRRAELLPQLRPLATAGRQALAAAFSRAVGA
ncbi:MAG: hypothetical protein RLZ55_411 [Actinomycetota bacterium]